MTKKISRRSFIKQTTATVALAGMSSILMTQQAPAYLKTKNYNVLLILNDQERAWPYIPKSIDLPARRYLESISTYFNRSYTSTPICSPARSSVYTGQHVQFTGVWDNTVTPWVPGLYDNVNTIGHLLRNQDYETGYFGKWHLTNITDSNVNENALGYEGMKKMFANYGFDNSDQPGERDLGQGGYKFDGLTAESTSRFIKEKKGIEKPWSAFVNFVNPHDIMFFRASPEILGTGFIAENQKFAPNDPIYEKEHDFDFPENFGPRFMGTDDFGTEIMNIAYGEISYKRPDLWRRFCNYYFNCLRDVDRHMMKLIHSLEETGQMDNTIIFMISDHGEMLGQQGSRGKIVSWEESIRVPTLVYHPDLKDQRKCNSVISNIDIVPTLLEFTGLSKSELRDKYPELKGNSYAELVENVEYDNIRNQEGHLIHGVQIIPAVFEVAEKFRHTGLAEGYWEKAKAFMSKGNFLPNFAPPLNYKGVVDKKYKFLRFFSPRQNNIPINFDELSKYNADYQLYDLENDPFEMNDLAKDENNRKLLMAMNNKCNRLADKEIGLENHVLHLPGPDWFWTA
ncbi:MAG: hypothetical protein CMP35_00875 [Rickettsiales bacterium]|nr:hypothetical protein [Rickettsiales bacterium]